MAQIEAVVSDVPASQHLSLEGATDVWLVSSPLGESIAKRAAKRTIDLLVGLVAVVIALPLMLGIALAIVLDSRGSPIYVHHRIGRNGVPFGVLKFRSMVRDAEHRRLDQFARDPDLTLDWQRLWKVRDDPRVTRVGRVLRKYSLDELPQFFNVVVGQMSLVGPRPVVEDELERFGDTTPLVLSVRPGLTGLWTVNGRNDISYEERVALEVSYVRSWRLLLDFSILLKTLPCVLTGRGAY